MNPMKFAWHAEVYEREVDGMLEEVEMQFGTREFVGVHARVEGDWEQQCRAAQNRTDPSTMLFNNKHQCWVRCLLRPSWASVQMCMEPLRSSQAYMQMCMQLCCCCKS